MSDDCSRNPPKFLPLFKPLSTKNFPMRVRAVRTIASCQSRQFIRSRSYFFWNFRPFFRISYSSDNLPRLLSTSSLIERNNSLLVSYTVATRGWFVYIPRISRLQIVKDFDNGRSRWTSERWPLLKRWDWSRTGRLLSPWGRWKSWMEQRFCVQIVFRII